MICPFLKFDFVSYVSLYLLLVLWLEDICLSKLFNLSMLRILKFGILVDTEILRSEWVNINLITFICQY